MILVSNPKWCFLPFEEALEDVREDFDGWEILAEKEHDWSHRDEIKDSLSTTDMEIQIHAPLNDINLASINPRMRKSSVEEIERCMEMASMIDMDIVTVHPGVISPLSRYWDSRREKALESLRSLNQRAEEYGITLAIENLPDISITMCTRPEEVKYFLERLDISFCLDIGHAYTSEHIDEFLEMDPVNVHLHDNRGDRDLHLPIGDGEIDLESVLAEMKGYDGNYVIEGRGKEELLESRDRVL